MTKKSPLFNPQRLREMGILDKWHEKTFDDFTGDDVALDHVMKYLKNCKKARAEGIGLYLYGVYGVGKTHLMNCLIKALHEQRYRVRIITLATLVTKFTSAWYDAEERNSFLGMIQGVDFLAIDDLGKEYKDKQELGLRVFDNIVRYRLQANLPMIFTANLPPKEIKDYYSEALASMLSEMCAMVKVEGKDHRKDIGARNKKIIT